MPSGKTIGRILSLGFPLPGTLVDNYDFISAPSFFDYDAMVVEIGALSILIHEVINGTVEHRTFGGVTVRGSADSTHEESLAEIVSRRRDETKRLLDNGGVIVCFARPARRHNIGAVEVDEYEWLPDALASRCRTPSLIAGEGSQVHIVDAQHPLAGFVLGQSANIEYRAHFSASAPVAGVFARSHGGAAVGVELPSDAGRLIMLPALKSLPVGDGRYTASDELQAGIRRALGVMAPGREPPWAAAYDIPGLADRASAQLAAQTALEAAQCGLADADAAYDELARYRRLLWQEGAIGLDVVVLDALRRLGFDVYDQDPNAPVARIGDKNILVEVEASEHSIDLAPHYRLRQRIEQAIDRGEQPRGVIFVNGQRLAAPSERQQPITDALRLASETMRYGVATTLGLFQAGVAHLSGDEDAVQAYRCRLLHDEGLIG